MEPMAFTGDLENLHIVDIIQLLHSTRKSGTFSVRGSRGESRIIFSNGYIVAANHLNSRVRIGSVMVKADVISIEDLKEALEVQKNAGKDRKPLLVTLAKLGKITNEEATKWLKELIGITIVELMDWTEGAFTFDAEAIAVSPQCSYLPGKMDQEMSLDAQMVLMDALRIYDERKRDRESGKDVPSYEEMYGEVIPSEGPGESGGVSSVITVEDLGLENVDRLEEKIRRPFSVKEIFDPLEIHRQHIRKILADFSVEEQDNFVSFLEKSTAGAGFHKASARREGETSALIFFSRDELIQHAFMTICKDEGIPVFTTDGEDEIEHLMAQCLSKKIMPILVYDSPEKSGRGFSAEQITKIRHRIKDGYPQVPRIQLAFPLDYNFMLQSYSEGVSAVLPKPLKDARKDTFIEDTIKFLEAFKSYIRSFLSDKKGPTGTTDN